MICPHTKSVIRTKELMATKDTKNAAAAQPVGEDAVHDSGISLYPQWSQP